MQKLKTGLRSFGLARIIIIAFLIVILITAAVQGQNMGTLFSDSLVRIFMNLPLSLAMIPAMNSGIGMNMGLPIGILGGLMGGIISIELGVTRRCFGHGHSNHIDRNRDFCPDKDWHFLRGVVE